LFLSPLILHLFAANFFNVVKLFILISTDMETICFWCLWLPQFHQTCFSVCFFFLFQIYYSIY
jgi:hypothetical protein